MICHNFNEKNNQIICSYNWQWRDQFLDKNAENASEFLTGTVVEGEGVLFFFLNGWSRSWIINSTFRLLFFIKGTDLSIKHLMKFSIAARCFYLAWILYLSIILPTIPINLMTNIFKIQHFARELSVNLPQMFNRFVARVTFDFKDEDKQRRYR